MAFVATKFPQKILFYLNIEQGYFLFIFIGRSTDKLFFSIGALSVCLVGSLVGVYLDFRATSGGRFRWARPSELATNVHLSIWRASIWISGLPSESRPRRELPARPRPSRSLDSSRMDFLYPGEA